AQHVALFTRVPQAARNEEAGEREEKDHASPAGFGEVSQAAHERIRGTQAAAVVKDVDEQNGDSAQTVECWIAAARGRSKTRRGHWAQPTFARGVSQRCGRSLFTSR